MIKERLVMFLFNTHPDYQQPLDPVGAETHGIAEADEVERFLTHRDKPCGDAARGVCLDWRSRMGLVRSTLRTNVIALVRESSRHWVAPTR
ncbi:hypothetical protein IE4872_PC00498 (plasmid) [Rhizobium gallicum]|uniref:Uncharacterized protein n=1 Tax=Rhizobium gallicum TaxID=56730 RepID=A0A1L5NRL1_9HYPH|nr:hypothetical protein IE4872_PC00498 [Rhizobium gallicum]